MIVNYPIIAATHNNTFEKALSSPVEIIFILDANIMTVSEQIKKAHINKKKIFVHIDLASGIGKDKVGVQYLKSLQVDGIISTKASIIKYAKELNLITVQRFFALDSQGLSSITDIVKSTHPDMIEIMPGVATKAVKKLLSIKMPIIAGGLIDEKCEVLSALSSGAVAVSTGKSELWFE